MNDHLSRPDVASRLQRLFRDAAGSRYSCPLLSLAPMGFTQPFQSLWMLVSSYLTFSPLRTEGWKPNQHAVYFCCTILESPPLGVTQHPALRSSDFPRSPKGSRDHLSYSLYSLVQEIQDNISAISRQLGMDSLSYRILPQFSHSTIRLPSFTL